MNDETPEDRTAAVKRGHRQRGAIRPSERAQERYPLEEYPCDRCEKESLPELVDNGSEFYWHHQGDTPKTSWRSGCPRFGISEFCGGQPRPGTATSLWLGKLKNWRPRTEEEYQKALQAVEEQGEDDSWARDFPGREKPW